MIIEWQFQVKSDSTCKSLLSAFPENHGEQGHPDVEPILGLAEVGGPRVGVELWGDLEDPGHKVARWQNLIPSFPWIGRAQSKERKGSNFAA